MIIISHKSALEYWRLRGNNSRGNNSRGNYSYGNNSRGNNNTDNFTRYRRKSLPVSLPSSATIYDGTPKGLSFPVNLLVGCHNAKRKTQVVQSRVYTGPTPSGCLISIGEGVAVSTPPFCFFQMANELPLIKLIELGFEFCGSYSLPAVIESEKDLITVDNTSYGQPQLTSLKAIKDFVAKMEGISGQKKSFRALRYIADGSASPMETILLMLLTLPHKLGGYGLPMPVLNKRIELRKSGKRRSGKSYSGKSYYKCDFFWPSDNLAVEYDSDFYHTGADRIASDSQKRLDLTALGITVITITNRQVRNKVEFETIAKLIAGKLHKQLRYKKSRFQIAERELRGFLL